MEYSERYSTERQAAIALQANDGYAEMLKIGKNILNETERAALDCDDPAETIRLNYEAKGARRFFANLQKMLKDIAEGSA